MGLRFSRSAAVTLYLVGVVFAGRALAWQDEHPQAPPQVLRYSVATLAPLDVTVPAAVLRNGTLHAMLVELAAGSSRNDVRGRLGVSDEELEALYRLIETEGLGRQAADGGWEPLALALDEAQVERLAVVATPLAVAIADTLQVHWAGLDSMVSGLTVAGRLPLNQTGFVLVGDYLLGLLQAEAFWQAGLAPLDRGYAIRVYRMNPDEAPAGHLLSNVGLSHWQVVNYSPSGEMFGFAALSDPDSPLRKVLLGDAGPGTAAQLTSELIDAYRLWYLMGTPPDPPTRRILQLLEAVDGEGRLRVPIITPSDLAMMRSIARWLGEILWEHLRVLLPEIGKLAFELGYSAPGMLGEVALATWEMAVHEAVWDLVGQGLLLPPIGRRGQALVAPARR